ncbi:penicillin-binding protein 2 [Silvibacterium dinghuense]|nr:penicillin-binding protein 2 [Silvibacterium dinghuense]
MKQFIEKFRRPPAGQDARDLLAREADLPAIKLTVFQYVIVAVMAVLIFGLWRLQVVNAESWHALAEANRVRKVPILAPRGQLLDRDGRLLVDNYPSVSAFLVREQGHNLEPDLPLIARGLHMTVDDIHAILKKYRTAPKYQPLPLKQDITPDEQEFIEAHRDEMPELETVDEQRRLYPKDGFAANLIGYVGEVSEEMLNDPRYAYYEPGDVVGKSGVEESYDAILRGQDGSRDVLVDSHGREVGKLGTERSVPGKNLKLTIDMDIQRAAENALGDREGAIVALDPHTGEVLAMVSRPTFDPNQFAVRIGRDEWNKLITDPDHPLLNKAIQAQSPPGSTFKILMSVAGLEQHVAQDLKVNCQGGASFYGHFYGCDHHHGNVDIHNAIPLSCDTYYYTLAVRLGIDTIAKYAHEFGFGQKTGIDLPDEITGVMPSTEWKLKTFHEKWFAGETVSVGIGQGAVAATPIQLARALGGIASGGVLKRPHVVFPSELPPEYRQAILDSFPGSGDVTIPIDPESWETITDGMAATTDASRGGTAYASHLEGIDFAGKTGTAQVVNHSAGTTSVSSIKSQRANAWFVGMAPRRNPDIVVAVFWQHGGWGSGSAHLAAKVIEAFVDKQRRLDHNLVAQQVQPVEVGAVWSQPDDPAGFGGKPVDPHAKHGDPMESAYAGHFFLHVPEEPKAAKGAAAASALAEAVR